MAHSLGNEEDIDFAEIVFVKVWKGGMTVICRMLTGIKLYVMSVDFWVRESTLLTMTVFPLYSTI